MGYVKDGEKRYFIEVIAAGTLIIAAIALRRAVGHLIINPALLLTVKLLPLLPILLFGAAVWRFYQRCDELQRQTMLKTAGAASLLTLVIFMTWLIMQPVGLPPLTGLIAILVICGCTLLSSAVIKFLEGRAEGGLQQAFTRAIPVLCLAAMLLGLYVVLHLVLPVRSAPYLWSTIWMGGGVIALLIYRLLKHRLDL
ncbi:MAG TPA: hypothetical protein VHC39_13230 [Rhizomicrobium sp.]|nr:hypothetical protein [Rhizomicrobium sp.]